jgi:hypothetical protein
MVPLLILHVDQNYQITYWIIRDEVNYFSPVTIPQAIQLLKNIEFDLIISDPQNIAILKAPSGDVPVSIAGKSEHKPPTRHFLN